MNMKTHVFNKSLTLLQGVSGFLSKVKTLWLQRWCLHTVHMIIGQNACDQNRVLKCDIIKMKFLKLWDLSGYSERTMPKRPICQK